MAWDRRKPSWIKNAQGKALRRYLSQDVYPYSPYYQVRFEEAGVGQRGIKSRVDLDKVPLTTFDEIANPASVVLRHACRLRSAIYEPNDRPSANEVTV